MQTIINEIKYIDFNSKYEQPIINDILSYYNKYNLLLLTHRIQLYHILRRHKQDLINIKFKSLNLVSTKEKNITNNKLYMNAKNELVASFPYDQALVNLIKEVPTRKFNPTHKHWTININNITIPIIKSKLFDIFDVDESVTTYIDMLLLEYDESFKKSSSQESEYKINGLNGTLRPFQIAGVEYICNKKRILIGDEQGLGKTVESIASIIQMDSYPVLVICPNGLKYNWKTEWDIWSKEEKIISILDSNNIKIRTKNKVKYKVDENNYDADVYIINYDIVEKMFDKLKALNIQSVIIDESHYIKNYKAKRTKIIKKLVKNIDVRLLLSGTPILSTPSEIISQLTVLGRLDEFGGFWYFWNNYVIEENPNKLLKLNTELRKICYMRRLKKDVLPELPLKNHIIIETELDNYKEYNNAEKILLQQIIETATEEKTKENSVSKLQNIIHTLIENHIIDSNLANAIGIMLMTKYQTITIEQKYNSIRNWINDFFINNPTKKLVVFGIRKDSLVKLQKYYSTKFNYDVPIVVGDIDIEQRHKYVESFQNDDSVNLIFLNIEAGGTGLTLTSSSDLLMIEQPWTPGKRDQASDRIHRIGQTNDSVNIYNMLARDTIDYYIYKTINYKQMITSAVNQGEISKMKVTKINMKDSFFEKMFGI